MTRLVVQAIIFAVLFALWTWRLCSPIPDDLRAGMNATGNPFLVAKAAHVIGYAVLAALAATLPVRRRGRVILVGLLVLHGVATEVIQTYVPGRTGKVADVLIDWAGIALGALAARLRTRRAGTRP